MFRLAVVPKLQMIGPMFSDFHSEESESIMRKILKYGFVFGAFLLFLSGVQTVKAEAPLVEKYLIEGKLGEGTKFLEERLKNEPKDDQARFGLGVIQFVQTFEHVGGSFYKYGLRTEKAFLRPAPEIREFLPQNPNPEKLTYAATRQMVQTFVDDLARVEATLSRVGDPNVKLPLHVGLIKMDPFGQGKPISAAFLFGRIGGPGSEMSTKATRVVVGFDRGDVCWLRGYCHLLAAIGELLLAVDGQKAFDCSAHLLFEKVETPHAFLMDSRGTFDGDIMENRPAISDVISFFHQLIRLSVKEPARTKAALAHLEAGVAQGKEQWKHILAETDDDNEWLPNPKQTGVMGVKVTREMIDTWVETLTEAEQVLQGKMLLPFWRGKPGEKGLNLRRVFTEPQTFDLVEWIQGPGATPYLETGTLTKFADPRLGGKLNNAFGDPANIIWFGFWFN